MKKRKEHGIEILFWVNEPPYILYVDGYNRLLLAFFRGYGITNKNRLSSIKFIFFFPLSSIHICMLLVLHM